MVILSLVIVRVGCDVVCVPTDVVGDGVCVRGGWLVGGVFVVCVGVWMGVVVGCFVVEGGVRGCVIGEYVGVCVGGVLV